MSNTDGVQVTEAAEIAEEAHSFGGVASFADAETREILNLLNQGSGTDEADGGSCCGGGCCS